MAKQSRRMNVTVVIPIFNDWESLQILLQELEHAHSIDLCMHLILVDDASTQPMPEDLFGSKPLMFASATYLQLKSNVGHQRAIAIALSWLASTTLAHPVLVMDGDGEDKPSDVPRLLEAFFARGEKQAVFAERTKRSESMLFKTFYQLYRGLHRIMVGFPVKIGNFSIIPFEYVQGLTVSNYLWYHYAATVVRTRMAYSTIKTSRGDRYRGVSKMNFVSLVRHGIAAIAVQAEVLSVRMLIAACVFTLMGVAGLAVVLWIRFFTSLAIPGWATNASGLIVVLLLQVLSVAFTFAMQSISIHGNTSFMPAKDCAIFLRNVRPLRVESYSETVAV